MYFSTYQAIARDEQRPGLFKDFPRDFFDLIIVDECHPRFMANFRVADNPGVIAWWLEPDAECDHFHGYIVDSWV